MKKRIKGLEIEQIFHFMLFKTLCYLKKKIDHIKK